MPNIAEYLSSAPKKHLTRLHGLHCRKGGLIANNQILSDLKEWVLENRPLEILFEKFGPRFLDFFRTLLSASSRGCSLEELQSELPEVQHATLKEWIQESVDHLLLVEVQLTQKHYLAIRGQWEGFFQLAQPNQVAPKGTEVNTSIHVGPRLIQLFGLLKSNRWKVSRQGSLFRRNQTTMASSLTLGNSIPSEISEEYTEFLFQLAIHGDFIQKQDDTLYLTPKVDSLLNLSHGKIWTKLLGIWSQSVRAVRLEDLQEIFQNTLPCSHAGNLASWFWVHSGMKRKKYQEKETLFWSEVPQTLKELWFLGILNIHWEDQQICGFSATSLTSQLLASCAEADQFNPQPIYATPDFEVLLPISADPQQIFVMNQIASIQSDDFFIRFRLEKERLLAALKNGLTPEEIDPILNLATLPPNLKETLASWISIHTGSELSRPLILEVKSEQVREQLKNFAPFREIIVRELPEFGFIMQDDSEGDIRTILPQFGLEPPPIPEELDKTESLECQRAIAYSTESLVFEEKEERPRKAKTDHSDFSVHNRSVDVSKIKNMINWSILKGKKLELVLRSNNNQKCRIQPLVLKGHNPEMLEAKDLDRDETVDIIVPDIVDYRIISD